MHQAPRDCDIVLRHAAALKKLCERRKVRQGRLTLSNCRARAARPYRYKRSLQREQARIKGHWSWRMALLPQ